MTLIRAEHDTGKPQASDAATSHAAPVAEHDAPPVLVQAPTVEQTVRTWHDAGRSQRAIARELNIDRRKVKQIIEQSEAA
jgi:hypothetical protein